MNETELYEEIKTLSQKLEQTRQLLFKQGALNQNLKRIMTERANAMRGLSPKKQHSGYVILGTSQCRKMQNGQSFLVWRSILQTPYDAGLPFSCIRNDIWYELKNDILYPLGIRTVCGEKTNGIIPEEKYNDKDYKDVFVYQWSFKANFFSGLWEMELFHINDITVPEQYRPLVKTKH